MTIDLPILMSLVQLVVIGSGGLYFIWTMQSKLELLIQETKMRHAENSAKFTDIEKQLATLATSTVELVKQQLRLDHMDDRLNEVSKLIAGERTARLNRGTRNKG